MDHGPLKPLWTCPRCGHRFVTPNLWHSCGRYDLADHFEGKEPALRRTFDRLVATVRRCGPVTVYAQKSRIVFMVRVRFGGVVVKKHSIDFALWLTRRIEHPRLVKTETFGARSYGAHFRLTRPEDVDRALEGLIREAYKTGRQEHLLRG